MLGDVNNYSIFRYGPWMETNLAVPLDATRCKVVFDYFLDGSLLVSISQISCNHFVSFQYIIWRIFKNADLFSLFALKSPVDSSISVVQDDQNFIDRSLKDSEQVQVCYIDQPMFLGLYKDSSIQCCHQSPVHIQVDSPFKLITTTL